MVHMASTEWEPWTTRHNERPSVVESLPQLHRPTHRPSCTSIVSILDSEEEESPREPYLIVYYQQNTPCPASPPPPKINVAKE